MNAGLNAVYLRHEHGTQLGSGVPERYRHGRLLIQHCSQDDAYELNAGVLQLLHNALLLKDDRRGVVSVPWY